LAHLSEVPLNQIAVVGTGFVAVNVLSLTVNFIPVE